MPDRRIENLNVFSEDLLETPEELKRKYPLTEKAVRTVQQGQQIIKNILTGHDHRLFVVVGPCSIHDVEAAREYAAKLHHLAQKVQDTLYLVMRVYFEKPRTRIGWQGLINDPRLDNSGRIDEGLHLARALLLDLAEMGLPVAGEALDLISPQYVQDLFSWTAIGARTTESQTHRKMASGFSSAVGFKNATDGDLAVAVNAMLSAAKPNCFLSVHPNGKVAVVRTKGNPYTHIVLRGGGGKPNYTAESMLACERLLRQAGLPLNIMVDCSHANSGKEPDRQIQVLEDVEKQILGGNQSIKGIMLESNLNAGRQDIRPERSALAYGVSITDACIDWQTTEKSLLKLRTALRDTLPTRARTALGVSHAPVPALSGA